MCSPISLPLACIPDLCTRVNLGRGCWFCVSRCQGYSHSVCLWDSSAASPWNWPVWSNRAVRCSDTLQKWRSSKKTKTCFLMAFCERKNGAQCLGVQWQVDSQDLKDCPLKCLIVSDNKLHKKNCALHKNEWKWVLAHIEKDLVRLELLESFSSKVTLGKACCWSLLLFSRSFFYFIPALCLVFVFLWFKQIWKNVVKKWNKAGCNRVDISPQWLLAVQLWGTETTVYSCGYRNSYSQSIVPLQCNAREYLSVTGPFVDSCRARWVAFVLKAQLCLAQSLFLVF